MTMPIPIPIKNDGEIERNEAEFIMDSTLKDKHRREPTILAFINSFMRCKSIKQACEESV